jgi:hypothetical protein
MNSWQHCKISKNGNTNGFRGRWNTGSFVLIKRGLVNFQTFISIFQVQNQRFLALSMVIAS